MFVEFPEVLYMTDPVNVLQLLQYLDFIAVDVIGQQPFKEKTKQQNHIKTPSNFEVVLDHGVGVDKVLHVFYYE